MRSLDVQQTWSVPPRARLVLAMCVSPTLAGLGCVGFQLIAQGTVWSWAAVALLMLLVAFATCWAERRSFADLWHAEHERREPTDSSAAHHRRA
ncbi:MAG TPA: hypothetical protein VGJ60_19225 [Chloroflexota bacterium]|jgi:hypothetical protein